ncbi:bifunctional diguanylate cyclase/phosphodiesterase [Alkalispirochaeta alkalica]|uniref:bifunctional diguanylate cyclase/phosphodiesterase n=1 Tax=Alkalispirochaeta alkalica TaxID=46356 RepID=UPI0003822C38|nr:bifunctional diguanylate cyclase/phosphodiesterase [Alkalispirochaeta alkalica]
MVVAPEALVSLVPLILAGFLFLLWRRSICSSAQVYRDSLTGLPGRPAFDRTYLHPSGKTAPEAIIFLSIDNLRRVNELFGYRRGDEVLKQASHRIGVALPPRTELYRFSGETFVVACFGDCDPSAMAETVLKDLREISPEGATPLTLLCTAGIAMKGREDLTDAADLVRGAAAANAAAREQGNPHMLYSRSLREEAFRKVRIARLLSESVEDDSFTMHYQPIHDSEGNITALEALLRWSPPGLGPVSPDEFIPLAESSGLIIPLGEKIIHRVLEETSFLPSEIRPPVHINISPVQLESGRLQDQLDEALLWSGRSSSEIILEVTESHLIHRLSACSALLQDLQVRGYRIALDDFGAGFSSLQYLHQLPVDILKIDRSFLRYRQAPERTARILSAFRDLGEGLNIEGVAEGVESEEQFHLLRTIGFCRFQGYFFSKPQPLGALLPFFTGSSLCHEEESGEHRQDRAKIHCT